MTKEEDCTIGIIKSQAPSLQSLSTTQRGNRKEESIGVGKSHATRTTTWVEQVPHDIRTGMTGPVCHTGKLIEYQKYDYLGQILTVHDHEVGGPREFAYDESGNLVVRRDPDGFELQFSYDEDNRLVKVLDRNGDYELILNLDGLGRPHFAERLSGARWPANLEL